MEWSFRRRPQKAPLEALGESAPPAGGEGLSGHGPEETLHGHRE